MTYKIKSTDKLEGTIILPSSKSISNRILILNALCCNTFEPENISDCDDTKVMLRVLDSDGSNFDIGAAGTAMRFLTAFLAKTFGEWTITGTERMKNRPIRLLVDAIEQLGGKIEYMEKEGYPPLRIFGSALNGGKLELDGGVSSQYISALMMIAPYMRDGLTLELTGKVISKPYIRLTAQLMMAYGAKVVVKENRVSVLPGEYTPIPYFVESDWSAASYWYQMVALAGAARIELPHLLKHSLQGDSYVAELFDKLGVQTTYNKEGVVLTKKPVLSRKMIHNFVDQPDLAQTFVVTCCLLNIPFYFSGLQSLKIKETDRIEALKNEMRKLGYVITDKKDSVLEWNGERCNASGEPVHTYEDHRMAMAFAPAALRMGDIEINDPQVVSKSYPHYWEDLQKAGLKLE
ncbi:MAG: 3-phosphoshikimate 1-carboxyvinyltransferase, partial [Bacteroidales bacterium]